MGIKTSTYLKIKKSAIFSILLLSTALPLAAEATWDTAVSYYKESQELKPYSMGVLSKTYNGKGEIEKTEEMMYALNYNAQGETVSELIRALEDGKDITEQKKKENRNNQGRGGPPGESEDYRKSPLDPALQNDVTAFDTGMIQYKQGQRCTVWEFRLKLNSSHDAAGKAWISTETGAAVSLKYRLEPNFPFVEEMNISLDYRTDNSNRFLLEQLRFDGRVNLIIMKKSFVSVTSFSDYR